ncbi:MAG: hypothetical protein IPK74_17815 [Deltaproteobacteria bacterium]|nr:hypothetical protein [Deltaproteobacteria bacterium]
MTAARTIAVVGLVVAACVCEVDDGTHARARVATNATGESAPAPAIVASAPAPAPTRPVAVAAEPAAAEPAPLAAEFVALPRRAAAPEGLVLDDAGAEPRRVVAWRARKGQREQVQLSLGLEVALALGTRVVPSTTIPALTVSLLCEVVSTGREASALALSVTDVQVPSVDGAVATPRVQQALTRVADELRTTSGTLELGADGRLGRLELSSSADGGARELAPERGGLVAALQELLPVMPRAPIGVGARWTVTQTVRREGATLQQTREHHLTALDEHGATVSITTRHVAITDDAAAATVALDRATPMIIEAASGAGTATLVLRDDHVLPHAATADVDGVTRAQVQIAGAPESIAMRTRLHAALRADDSPAP